MPRMLGAWSRPRCPYCRTDPGPDCPDTARSKGAARAAENRQWRREHKPLHRTDTEETR